MRAISGGVTAPKGFRASGVAAGIRKKAGRKDCALVVSDCPSAVAGMFTTNVMKSPPVKWNMEVCRRGSARAVFINSGNANAATGEPGYRDAVRTAELVGAGLGIAKEEVCVCSTGVIGVRLPMQKIEAGVRHCIEELSVTGSGAAAEAIMTTDTVPKEFARELTLGAGVARLGCIAKGSGMIAPNLATMICVITTDAWVAPGALRELLGAAVDRSFHQICVDNDLSTSDTVLAFANGQSGVMLEPGTGDFEQFGAALTELCETTAKALVKDGEGATKFVEIVVSGAATDADARRVARAVGMSQLCKTAFFGEDANWGRIACAAGYAGVNFDPSELDISLDGLVVARGGLVAEYKEEDAAAIVHRSEFRIGIRIGNGPGRAVFWTSDLSHDYVSINADYRS